jgi:hypothetical protein
MRTGKRISNENRRKSFNPYAQDINSIKQTKQKYEEPMNFYPLHSDLENDSTKYDLEVGFLIVATGKYDIFVEPLIRSIEKYFLTSNKKFYNIFSDKNFEITGANYSIFPVEHKPFPYPTLYRFHFFENYRDLIKGDQLIYIDADTLITSEIGTEVLTPITATQHCGYLNRRGTFENRMESKCFVHRFDEKNYYGGGFYSFSRDEFFKMSVSCKEIVDWESSRGRIPIWHDESVLNKYLTLVKPTRVLSPSYHYPEDNQKIYSSWGTNKFECKILLLNKNHKEIRS